MENLKYIRVNVIYECIKDYASIHLVYSCCCCFDCCVYMHAKKNSHFNYYSAILLYRRKSRLSICVLKINYQAYSGVVIERAVKL